MPKYRTVNHNLVYPDVLHIQTIFQPCGIFLPTLLPPSYLSSGTGDHLHDHGAGTKSVLKQNGQATACGTIQALHLNRGILTVDQLIDSSIEGMYQPCEGSQIRRMAQTARHAKVIAPWQTVHHAGRLFTGFMQHGNHSSPARKRLGGEVSYVAGVPQDDRNGLLNDMGFHTPPFLMEERVPSIAGISLNR